MLDIRTMFFMLVLSAIIAGVGAFGLNVNAERRSSARSWGLGSLSISIGILLLGLRDIIPLWPSAVIGNSLMFWGFMLVYVSLRQLLKKPLSPRVYTLVALGYSVTFHFLITLDVATRYRVIFGSVFFSILAIMMIHTARSAQSQHTRSASALMQFFYYIVLITWLSIGLHAAFFASEKMAILEQSAANIFSLASFYIGIMGAGISCLLMQSGLAYNDLAVIANNDSLTGVRNHHNLMEMADRDWALAQRMWRPLSVMMLDLDNFKKLNDNFGYVVGDEALRRFGEVLAKTVRAVDLTGRYDGEEFCIVLTDTSPQVARHSAERIRRDFEAMELMTAGRRVPLSVSIGIAGMSAGDTRSLRQLLSAADNALQAAKAAGGNCVRQEEAHFLDTAELPPT